MKETLAHLTALTELAHLCLQIKWRMHINLHGVRSSVCPDWMPRLGECFGGQWSAFN